MPDGKRQMVPPRHPLVRLGLRRTHDVGQDSIRWPLGLATRHALARECTSTCSDSAVWTALPGERRNESTKADASSQPQDYNPLSALLARLEDPALAPRWRLRPPVEDDQHAGVEPESVEIVPQLSQAR